eukprot:1160070-Pelagomonas_calceolata.AAC.6
MLQMRASTGCEAAQSGRLVAQAAQRRLHKQGFLKPQSFFMPQQREKRLRETTGTGTGKASPCQSVCGSEMRA